MKRFNKDKYLRRLKLKRMLSNNSRKIYFILLCLSCFIIGIYFAHSKFFVSEDQEIIRTTVGDFSQGDVIIGAYLNGEYSSAIPPKNNGYIVNNVVCDHDATGEWDNDNWLLTIKNLSQKTKCNLYFIDNFVYKYDFTGVENAINIRKSGTYKLEVWGAQGGSGGSAGGYGSYSTGLIHFNKDDTYYINVGGTTTSITGGYNGGGNSLGSGGGGGATHIASASGLLESLEDNNDAILIVAGGGGGTGKSGAGGNAGGINGKKGSDGSCSDRGGNGGTQTAGGGVYNSYYAKAGSFGHGGDCTSSTTAGGGGAGYYGGGGGGSGYIGNSLLTDKSMYCYNCTTSTATNTKTISTSCSEKTPTEKCAKKGAGYAKITYIEEN